MSPLTQGLNYRSACDNSSRCSVWLDGSNTVGAPVNWTKGRRLGAGGFGQVFICHDLDTGRDLAVKEVLVACSFELATEVVDFCSYFLHFLANCKYLHV